MPCRGTRGPRNFSATQQTAAEREGRPANRERNAMMKRREFLGLSAGLVAAPFVSRSAIAAGYPDKPVHWIVGYPPGGSTDILARLMGNYLSQKLNQQFIIENKAGAGNNIATEYVVNAPADGYTVLLVNPANGINTTLYKHLNFNFVRDITAVGGITRVPNVMTVNPNVPAKNVQEFIDYVKANPGKVNMASSGNGTSVHLSGELFMKLTGVKMTHVPYRGSNPALTDLLAGQCQVIFDNMPSVLPHIQGGKLRALAVTTEQRSPQLPDVPSLSDTVKGYEASAWFGMGAPAKTPKEVIAVLNKTMNQALADDNFKKRIADLGGMPMGGPPEDFEKIIVSETEKWKKVVEFSGASIE
jgi:tripartite-type tricarboxylate transporter receptor subunit TctC